MALRQDPLHVIHHTPYQNGNPLRLSTPCNSGQRRCVQVLVNGAIIVADEFSPAEPSWYTRRDVMHLLDLFCCSAVLSPVARGVEHLHKVSFTDGKANRCAPLLLRSHACMHANMSGVLTTHGAH